MRILLLAPLLLAGACNVNRDPGNDTTTVSFNEAVAENAAEDVGNAAENIGGAISNEVGDVDVDVDRNKNETANSTENEQ